MSQLLQTLAAYIPPSVIREMLATPSPQPPAQPRADNLEAAVLFADVSGFTPLTEALARQGAEGPEELTRLLNSYFERMIALIEDEGGEIVKFSGDAVTVLFPAGDETLGHATRRALQAAEAMQAAMVEFATLPTSAGPVALGMKIGIGAGEILVMRVGGVFNRWEYVIAGDPLRQVAEAEHQAERGDVILSPEAAALIWPQPLPPRPLARPDWSQIENPAAVEAVLRAYVPGAVSGWLREGLQEWLAVLRPMSVLFIGVGGLNYSQADALDKLHAFLRVAQETIYRFEGSLNKLAVDDKGTILIALLGAPPHAHEDDPERALRAAMALQSAAQQQGLSLAIGVTTGRVFSGPVGSRTRREYTVMGDTVNLAARLMAAAGLGDVRCDHETYRRARTAVEFDLLEPVRVKGKAGLIRVYRPTLRPITGDRTTGAGELIGRRAELAWLAQGLKQAQQGQRRILVLEGEAGIGKSRLVAELADTLQDEGLTALLGAGYSIEQQTPYRAWRDIFNTYFALEKIEDQAERRRRVLSQAGDLLPELAERLPLLDDVLGLGLPNNPLTAAMDTQLRHDSLVSLLITLLRRWAAERPLVIVLEDAHWLDSLSWELAVQVPRALDVARAPLLLVVVMRPFEEELPRPELQLLLDMPHTERRALDSLSPEETVALATLRLGLAPGQLPRPVAELVRQRAGGNPFFAEELVYALRDNGLISLVEEAGQRRCRVSGDLEHVRQTLPDNIEGLVLARIDRLPPEKQLTLKVAAVIGRTFAYTTLSETLREHMAVTGDLLKAYLDELHHLALTPLDVPEPDLTYIFKHLITQEVAYETLLFAQRRQLHTSVAEWYERHFDPANAIAGPASAGQVPARPLESPLAGYYPLLVYHWRQAEDETRERSYAWLAGTWAAAQFANTEAEGYFSRALRLTPDDNLADRFELLLAREAVLNLRGSREAQAQDLAGLSTLAAQLRDEVRAARVMLRRGHHAQVTGDYAQALAFARQAGAAPDKAVAAEARVAEGVTRWRQGDYEAARQPLEQAIQLAAETDNQIIEARSTYYIAQTYLYQNNYPLAQENYERALAVYRAIGHGPGEADALNNLGVINHEQGRYPQALDYYEQVLALFYKMGDRHGQAVALVNLGTVYCDLGNVQPARDYLEKSLDLAREIGDVWNEALSHTNLALTCYHLADYGRSRQHAEQALTIQRDIGDRRNQGYSLTYLGHAFSGQQEWAAARQAYEAAASLRRELGQHAPAMDDLAGLARVALAGDDPATALAHTAEMLAWLDEHGTAGIEYPLQVYFTCYQTLQATANGNAAQLARARDILATAHRLLQEQANGIGDEALRRGLLENIAVNREILAAWQAV
ncbi:MAG: adenylate/guanylate cyclase domain-containing protein [Anaerolineae bacterium]